MGSNTIVVSTEMLTEIEERAALAGFVSPSAYIEHILLGIDAADLWDEALEAINDDAAAEGE